MSSNSAHLPRLSGQSESRNEDIAPGAEPVGSDLRPACSLSRSAHAAGLGRRSLALRLDSDDGRAGTRMADPLMEDTGGTVGVTRRETGGRHGTGNGPGAGWHRFPHVQLRFAS